MTNTNNKSGVGTAGITGLLASGSEPNKKPVTTGGVEKNLALFRHDSDVVASDKVTSRLDKAVSRLAAAKKEHTRLEVRTAAESPRKPVETTTAEKRDTKILGADGQTVTGALPDLGAAGADQQNSHDVGPRKP